MRTKRSAQPFPFQLPHEGRARLHAQEWDLALVDVAHELAAVVMTELQAAGHVFPVFAELPRLEGFEAGSAQGSVNADALRGAAVRGEEDRRRPLNRGRREGWRQRPHLVRSLGDDRAVLRFASELPARIGASFRHQMSRDAVNRVESSGSAGLFILAWEKLAKEQCQRRGMEWPEQSVTGTQGYVVSDTVRARLRADGFAPVPPQILAGAGVGAADIATGVSPVGAAQALLMRVDDAGAFPLESLSKAVSHVGTPVSTGAAEFVLAQRQA